MTQPAHLIIENAAVYTVDDANPTAEAVAVRGNRVAFVGSNQDTSSYKAPHTRVVDAGGCTLMPGFIDSHFHLMWGAIGLADAQLFDVRSMPELERALSEQAASNPDEPWVGGQGVSYILPSPTEPLTRHHLDAIVSDRPLTLFSYDFHTVWANTAALNLAGILHGGETGPGSQIVMGADGLATGELREPAAFEQLFEHRPELSDTRKMELVREALQLMAADGITSIHNMDGTPEQTRLYAAMEDSGYLTARIYMPFDIKPETPIEAITEIAVPMREEFQTQFVRAGAVKFFMDGVLESFTALLLDPYADDQSTVGEALFTQEHFNRMAAEADRLGFQIAVHACGDGAVRRVLDGYEVVRFANGKHDSRHRVEHIELIHPDDVHRFKELGVIVSMQPLHAPMIHKKPDVWPTRAGRERWHRSFAWRTLLDAGAMLALGSDWSVASFSPSLGLDDALNRQPWGDEPTIRMTLEEAIAGYTINAAYTEFQEDVKGQIKVDMLADLVLLSENIFEMDTADIANVHPLVTISDGRVVYEA